MNSRTETDRVNVDVDYHQIYTDEDGDPETIVCELSGKGYVRATNELSRFDHCPGCGKSLGPEGDSR